MMNGGVAELACRNRLRSRDIKVKEEEEGEEEEEDYDDDDEEEEEEDEDEDSDNNVKKWKTSSAVLDKEKKRKVPNNSSNYEAKEKNKHEKRPHDDKTKYRKASTTTIGEKKNELVSSHGREKARTCDHDKDKRRNTPLPLDKNKDSLKEKSRKIPSIHSAGKKIHNGNHYKDKRTCMCSKCKRREKEKGKNMSTHSGEDMMRTYDHCKHKVQSEPHLFNNNEMQKNELKKKKNTPLDLPKKNKTQMMKDSKKENKRKKTPEIFNKSKKMKTEDKDEKAGSGDRWKTNKKTMEDYNKEQKVPSGDKEKRNVTISFFKLIYDNFEKFLLLPPVVATKLMDLTNRRVNLQDSEGKFSEVRSQFSVRVFGMNSCERVCFSVEGQGGPERKGCHEPDKMENVAVSGARRVAVNSKEDPSRVVSGVEHGSSIALDVKDGYLANGKYKPNGIYETWSKGTRGHQIILIADDEAPLTQKNEDTEKLKTLHTPSDMHAVSANTKENPKGAASGIFCRPSVDLDNKEGTLAIGECKTNCISSICSTEKTIRSEIIPVSDAAPLAQENDDAVELTTFPLHIEDTSMMKESEPEIATPAKCTEIQDSDEDLRRKQEGNTVQLERTTAVDKCPKNSKMNTNGSVCSKHDATGGLPSMEKWKKATVSGRAALDGTGLIKPEKLVKTDEKLAGYAGRAALDCTGLIRPEKRLKTDDKLVGNCSATGVNPVEQSLRGYADTHSRVQQTPGKISKSIHIKTEIDLFAHGKGPTVQPKAQMDHAVSRSSEHHFFSQDGRKASHHVTPAVLLPVKDEISPAVLLPVKDEILELDVHSVLKTNLQFCIPSTTQTWLDLPTPLSNALRRKGRQDRNVVMLKDPMKRLWPVFYHQNSLFVGFTRGWKPFVAANSLRTGDVCLLLKDLDEDELVYHVQIARK
ncbi:hypothetical protein ACQ4PT_033799 [Festuca glaucescens]